MTIQIRVSNEIPGREAERHAYRKTFSDHFPVTVDMTAHDDED